MSFASQPISDYHSLVQRTCCPAYESTSHAPPLTLCLGGVDSLFGGAARCAMRRASNEAAGSGRFETYCVCLLKQALEYALYHGDPHAE